MPHHTDDEAFAARRRQEALILDRAAELDEDDDSPQAQQVLADAERITQRRRRAHADAVAAGVTPCPAAWSRTAPCVHPGGDGHTGLCFSAVDGGEWPRSTSWFTPETRQDPAATRRRWRRSESVETPEELERAEMAATREQLPGWHVWAVWNCGYRTWHAVPGLPGDGFGVDEQARTAPGRVTASTAAELLTRCGVDTRYRRRPGDQVTDPHTGRPVRWDGRCWQPATTTDPQHAAPSTAAAGGEVVGHESAKRYTAAMASAADAAVASLDATRARLAAAVTGPALTHLAHAQDQAAHMATALKSALAVLTGHDAIAEAYGSAPDAGDKTWMTRE